MLVERDREVAAIEQALADARDGAGGVILIEAPAGKGKSRLLTVAGDMARDCDMQVVGAHGNELEVDFPFGIAIQLFEPRWSAAEGLERRRLLQGPARHVEPLLRGDMPLPAPSPEDQAYAVIHGLFWLCTNLVSGGDPDEEPSPLLMLVDDVQWADRPSLRFLAYLADRIADLPIALLVALRAGEEVIDRAALTALRREAADQMLRPGSLSESGVDTLVTAVFPDAEPAFAQACARVTSGNPFLLTELLRQLYRDEAEPDASTAANLLELPPESVINSVVARLDRLPASARKLARTVAVLGPGVPVALVAELAELRLESAVRAADVLAAVHLFAPGTPLGFVHPLVAAAIQGTISPLDSGVLHRRAAEVLMAHGSPAEQVAAHLMAAPPGSDAAVVESLRIAACRALASGSAPSAVRFLERALAENPPAALHSELLAELAEAESAAGLPHAINRLEHALSLASDGELRVRLALTQARAHYDRCQYREAAEVLSQALGEVEADNQVVEQLEAAYIASAFFVPELEPEAAARAGRLLERIGRRPSATQLDVLAHMAVHGGLRGETQKAVSRVARAAWHDGALLEAQSLDGLSWPLVSGAMLYVGEVEFSLEVCDAALQRAREEDSPAAYAAACYCRAWPLYEQGRVAEAAADAHAGLDARPDGWRNYLRPAYAALALCHLHSGALEQAETALALIGHSEIRELIHAPALLDARAQLRLAQHRPGEALEDALEAGKELERRLPTAGPGAVAWRSTAALAKLTLGDHEGARELAAAELSDALRIAIPRLIVRDLRILGLAERGQAGLDLLAEAVARGDAAPPRLEHIHALLDYGSELRRANRRSAAREPLRRALDLAHRCGASALAQRARTELAASGARPRREMLSGIDALTPSERRVADLAAKGLTTRQIAEALFVTPKTVEFHLRHTYQKLDVNSRERLARVLIESGD